jgi:hypothetical protein
MDQHDQQGEKITLLWVSGHVGVTGNENADTAAKNPERVNTKHRKVSSPRLHKVGRTKTSRGATRKMEHLTTELKKLKPHIRSNRDT